MNEFDFDMVVIGSGPAGQRAAFQAAKLNKRVAVVERRDDVGGACINTGTIPSKTVREAVLHLTGFRERRVYGESYAVKSNIVMEDLLAHTDHVMGNEVDVIRSQLLRNKVDVISAEASFVDVNTLNLRYTDGRGFRQVTARYIVISTGTAATKVDNIPFDGNRIFTSDEVMHLAELPRTLTVVGAGVIGLEYASIFATLGIRITLIDKFHRLLPFMDSELIDALIYELRRRRVTLRLGEEVTAIEPFEDARGERVKILLASGKQVVSDKALYSIGRTAATSTLNLNAMGVETDDRGRITVNPSYQTSVENVYAVGDVIGFPSLASTSMEQGRLASCHAFKIDARSFPDLFPYGIYSIPEMATVGRTEEDLTSEGVPYEVGKAQYNEIARGQIIGDETGLLKLAFHLETRKLLGVHIIGEGASDLIHIGQAVMSFGGDIDYFIDTVFNYPTLAECYKTAAFDGINRLGA